jgi:hypothetical protein
LDFWDVGMLLSLGFVGFVGFSGCLGNPQNPRNPPKAQKTRQTRKNSKNIINSVLKLYNNKLLNEVETAVIDSFLVVNKLLVAIDNNATISQINSSKTDSILKERQNYIYNKIPKIAKNKKELKKYFDIIPFHESYWDTRNKAMVQNILKQIKQNLNKKIVVLNGFYHRYYLIEELKKYEEEFEFVLKS